MDSFATLLLDIWREVGRQAALPETIDRIVRLLAPVLKVTTLEILNFEILGGDLIRLVEFPVVAERRHNPLPPANWNSLMTWARRGETVLLAAARWPPPFDMLRGSSPAMITIATALVGSNSEPIGIALFGSADDSPLPKVKAVVAQLREPLSVVLQHAMQARELSMLRASAEAERESLLHRLGRESLATVIVGATGGLRTVLQRVDQVARADSSVLLLGETGSGKEVIARAIHERSSRLGAPFIRVNCGAIPPDLIDSELFGHEKGSFTGASNQRKGWFERADRGTLFLDEIAELPVPAQVRLLRVLQEGNLFRVGGEQAVDVDVRIIAATHRDLASMVARGEFREDLWYRIAVFPILIPPLRDRPQDIPDLARHFAQRAAIKLGQTLMLPTDDDIASLRAYPWPGNIREMATVIERAAILAEGHRLAVTAALGLALPQREMAQPGIPMPTLDQIAASHIKSALNLTQGRIEGRNGAAELLGINPNTLRSRMRKLSIKRAPL